MSFWFPFQIVRDLSRGSSRTFTQNTWLGLWWGTWVAGLVLGQASGRISLGSPGSEGNFTLLPVLEGATAVALAVSLLAWIKIVTSIVRDQELAPEA